jgi:3-oxoacyl-(acyl-carrier-protein) synthase
VRHPVITGLGVIAAPGCGTEEIWQAIAANTSGLQPLTLFASPRYGQIPVGEIRQDLTALGAPLNGSRSDRLGWLAARDALVSAGLLPAANNRDELNNVAQASRLPPGETHGSDDPKVQAGRLRYPLADRAGIVLGCSVGGSFDSERFLTTLMMQGKMRPRPTRYHECASAVDLIADDFGLFGPSLAIATACSSGALAIATAAELIQSGQADVMLAGGTDSLARTTWAGFHSLLLVDSQGCRPFDATRGGMSLGEGAAVLVIEAEETARARGATILARLSGWGASCDAHHVTAPHPEGAGALAAMQSALRRAQLDPSAVNYVNAHGTGTRDNDLAEGKALKTLFGEHVPPFSSTKRFFGHALAASGAIEAVVCVEALRRQQIPSNPGFSAPDPAIGLQPVTATQPGKLTHVMSNSFGFGGNNAVLVFSAPDAPQHTRAADPQPAFITGLGVTGPGSVTVRDIEPPLPSGQLTVHSCGALADTATLTPNQRRRLSRINQMAILTARRAHKAEDAQRVAVAMGTGFGCLDEGAVFIENLIGKNEAEPMPTRFPGSVHNAPAGQIAIDLGARGLNSAPTAGEISFECALWQALRQLDADEADVALAGAIDELNKYPLAIGKRWGFWNEQTIPGEGAVVARLTSEAGASPLARVIAVRLGRYRRPFDACREAEWIAAAVDPTQLGVLLSGAGGWPALENPYQAVAAELAKLAGRDLEHQTYKPRCGEFPAASGLGFAEAVSLVRQRGCGVLLYTLSLRGGKALCCLAP